MLIWQHSKWRFQVDDFGKDLISLQILYHYKWKKISHNAPDNKMACKSFIMQYIALVLYCYNLEQGENKLHFKLEANAVMYENIISMYYNGTVFYFFIWFPHNNIVTTFASLLFEITVLFYKNYSGPGRDCNII